MIDQIILSWFVGKALDIIIDPLLASRMQTEQRVLFITPELGFRLKILDKNHITLFPDSNTSDRIGADTIKLDISDRQEAHSSLVKELTSRLSTNLDRLIDNKLDSQK
jgi:hypothetical protein